MGIYDLAKALNVRLETARMIHYLRTRSRYTEAAEAELVRMDHEDEPLPVMAIIEGTWPPKGSPLHSGFDMQEFVDELEEKLKRKNEDDGT